MTTTTALTDTPRRYPIREQLVLPVVEDSSVAYSRQAGVSALRSRQPGASAVFLASSPAQHANRATGDLDRWDFQAHVHKTELPVDPMRPERIRRLIDGYTPRAVSGHIWQRIAPTVRSLAHEIRYASPRVAATDLTVLTVYIARLVTEGLWVPEQGGWPPFDRRLIDGHISRNVTGTVKSVARHRSSLHRASRHLHPDQWVSGPDVLGHSPVQPPYSEEEMDLLLRHARSLRQIRGDVVPTLVIAVGRGAGLHGPDYRATWADNVHVVDSLAVVDIAPPNPRRVPLLDEWADLALDAAQSLPGRLLTGSTSTVRHNVVSKVAERFDRGCPVHLSASRLRHTWMVDLLRRGTPIDVIANAAGIKHLKTVEDLIAHVPPRTPSEVKTWLTGVPR